MVSKDESATGQEGPSKLWGGRFTGKVDPLMEKYNASLPFDRILYAHDIAGSIAFARANVATGILTEEEFEKIARGLEEVEKEWREERFQVAPEIDEDIHTANERRLGEIIGKELAGKLHTGRSRNDQVATDLRLWLRDELRHIEKLMIELMHVILGRAEREMDLLMPGYTHLQRGQPIRWSHWLLSYGATFTSDLERLREVISRVNRSPLGCGALSGNAFNIDRSAMAVELGFESVLLNSMAAVGDRDFILETMQWGSMLMLHISRWAEDLILYSSAEFGFVKLADAYTTGSSLMPQKKNSDSLELLRGKCGRVFGQMAGLSMTIKGLPSTYNKDLQESVEPLIEHTSTLKDSLTIASRVLASLTIFPENMRRALTSDMLATDLAEYLVRKGIPFRETHHIAGHVVQLAESEGKSMDQLSLGEFLAVDERFAEDVLDVFDFEQSVEMKSAVGGTARAAVGQQIETLRALIRPIA